MRPARASSISAPKAAARFAVALGRAARPNGLDGAQEDARRKTLQRLPAVEVVAVMPGKDDQVLLGEVVLHPHRRGEAAQERQGGPLRHITKDDRPLGVLEFEHPGRELVRARIRRRQRHVAAIATDQAESKRHRRRQLDGLSRSWSERLGDVEPVGLRRGVVCAADRDLRRTGLTVPAHEEGKVASGDRRKTADEILDRRRLAVVTLEIKVHAGAERLRADQALEHADDLRALLIDRRRIEVADLVIDLRSHVVREGARVLGKLRRAQRAHVGDAFHGRGAHVGRKFLIAEDGQALLEAELEPVPAGHAVAGPVVKILVRDHGLDAGVIVVGRRLRRSEDVFVVEDVEALVLHRAHIEIRDGDDVEHVEIVFAPVSPFVPGHRTLERVHGVARALLTAVLDIDRKRDVAARRGDEGIRNVAEIAGDQREQIARLLVRIAPDCEVASRRLRVACAFEIAVREQNRRLGAIRLQAHAIGREHVRPVEEIGDAAEPLGLALRAIGRAGAKEAHELGVGRRIEARLDLELERALGRAAKQELRFARLEIVAAERRAVQFSGNEDQFVAVEREGGAGQTGGIRAHRKGRDDARRMDVERYVEFDEVDEVVGDAIVDKPNGLSDRSAHGRPFQFFDCWAIRPEPSRSWPWA